MWKMKDFDILQLEQFCKKHDLKFNYVEFKKSYYGLYEEYPLFEYNKENNCLYSYYGFITKLEGDKIKCYLHGDYICRVGSIKDVGSMEKLDKLVFILKNQFDSLVLLNKKYRVYQREVEMGNDFK